MRRYILIIFILFIILFSFSTPAITQPFSNCMSISELVRLLRERYGEYPIAAGATSPNGKRGIGIYVNILSGSFSILTINTDTKIACIASSGKHFTFIPYNGPSEEAPESTPINIGHLTYYSGRSKAH